VTPRRTLAFAQVDAFTDRPLEGNACAVVFDADGLDDAAMLAVAREMNLSETAFVLRPRAGHAAARYFTPAEEIPLAGHPTVATVHVLVESGRLQLSGGRTELVLELRDGPIQVDVLADGGRVGQVIMSQRRPRFLSTHAPEDVLPAFGLEPGDALPDAPIQTVSTGTPQLMVPVRNHAVLRRAAIDVRRYSALRARSDFFSPHLFCLGGATSEGRTFARHFGVPPDAMEDPFTGSATGGMACYLWRYGLLDEPRFVAEQGHWMGRPGRASVEVVGPREAIEAVRVGGAAVTVMRGTLMI
jgi:trans-2,3-dihydro-3-hydroxyanthranilate isomerase